MMRSMQARQLVEKFGSPLYVYDASIIRARCRELTEAFPDFRLYYACKANTNPHLVERIASEGFDIEAVSPREIALALGAGVPASRIAYTCGSIAEHELVTIVKKGVRVHLDSLHQVDVVGRNFPGSEICVRLNQGIGAGHHAHVITGGPESKFGIDVSYIPRLHSLAKKHHLRIVGLHQHIGSNVLDANVFLRAMKALLHTASLFPDLKHLDFGGGFGVPYRLHEKRLDMMKLSREVKKMRGEFIGAYGRDVEMSFEPGRYLVAEAGELLTTVTDIKRNPKKTFVGIDSGMGHLIRPAMYGSHHEIENATHPKNRKQKVIIAGYYCESGDVFAKDRALPMPQVGDILVVKNAGAYGYTMASNYNLRGLPAEVLLDGQTIRLIRDRRH